METIEKANVIMMNSSIEFVVLGKEEEVLLKLEELKNKHHNSLKYLYPTDALYKEKFSWVAIPVEWSSKGIVELTESFNKSVNLVLGIKKEMKKISEYN